MASLLSKLARAGLSTRAVGGIAGGGRPAASIRVSPAGGPKAEEEKAIPKSRHLHVDENVFKSDEAMWAFYEHWCKFHGISRDRCEMERRFKTFSDSARHVHTFNTTVENGRGGVSMTKFADMTEKECSSRSLLGYRRKQKKKIV